VINGVDRDKLYEQLLAVAKKKTAEADVKLDDRGRPIQEEEDLELGDNCIIVPQVIPGQADSDAPPKKEPKGKGRRSKIATVEGDEPEAAGEPEQPRSAGGKPTRKQAAAKKPGGRKTR